MTPDQAVALAFADDAALNVAAFTPPPAVAEAPYAVVSSRDEDFCAALHRLHDAALDASNRILWPLLPRGDATHTAAALDAISARRELDACTNERLCDV